MVYKLFEINDLEIVFNFFQLLKAEGADISFTDVKTMEELENWFEDRNIVIVVAVEEDKLIAVARGKIGEADKSHSAFLTVAVSPDVRNMGIASHITKTLEKELVNRGVEIVRAYVYSDNEASIRTLQKQGFVYSGKVLMHHYDFENNAYVDDLIFHKLLERDLS
ncbi:MAG: GNAT family N-acetyltransferase [Clostridiales bacterium]|nr:GNAT family N-acetyltransferase [Clostridiales bacterium]